ncbi:hypothetical protein LCGC14_2598750 [marine sediment metagenome]|uniref:Uncharacterized protein n=1 Tax=marine sediment metagenome TaxID=412755 RepID=A0A0F9A9I3_9ZZZZ
MSWPEADPYMHELRRKWDEGHFRQDADSVYGIDEAIDEAITEISTYNEHGRIPTVEDVWGLAKTQMDYMEHHMDHPSESPAERVDYFFAQELAKGMLADIDRQFGSKTCRICRLTTHNDPCDNCYGRFRRASQTISETGVCVFCRNKSPSVICVPCVERVLRDGLGEGE